MSKHLEVIVRGVIEDGEGRILLVRLTPRDWWFLPGGHLDPGESVTECLRRELSEEAQLDVRPSALLAVVENRYRDSGEDRIELNVVLAAFAAGQLGAIEQKLEFRWVTRQELATVEVLPAALKGVALRGAHGPVVVELDGLTGDPNAYDGSRRISWWTPR
ncbi:NUDIX hydrolase [Micrococcales bacterium 31B]|nr:NUDIX hydrolase [Micrococcales bacterium 31B]